MIIWLRTLLGGDRSESWDDAEREKIRLEENEEKMMQIGGMRNHPMNAKQFAAMQQSDSKIPIPAHLLNSSTWESTWDDELEKAEREAEKLDKIQLKNSEAE